MFWPLEEFGRAVWWALVEFGREHPALAVTLTLLLAGIGVVLFVERE